MRCNNIGESGHIRIFKVNWRGKVKGPEGKKKRGEGTHEAKRQQKEGRGN